MINDMKGIIMSAKYPLWLCLFCRILPLVMLDQYVVSIQEIEFGVLSQIRSDLFVVCMCNRL